MLAVLPTSDPSATFPRLGEVPDPRPAAGEVLVQVRVTALNRADLLQTRGLYPPPPGESRIPGLECAGEIEAIRPGVTGWRPGDRVMALLAGAAAEIDLADVLRRRLHIVGSVLRARSREEKGRLVADFSAFASERLADGRLQPVVHQIQPFEKIADAYAQMEQGGVFGKLVLSFDKD